MSGRCQVRRLAWALAATVLAAAPMTMSAEATVDRSSKLPISEGMPQVRLPRAREATLGNGLRVFVLEGVDQIPTFTVRMIFTHAGGLYEPTDRRGVAGFTAQLLDEGTATRSSAEIARQLETLGATLRADAPLASAFASVSATGLSTHFAPTMALFADVIRNPAFPDTEVAQYASRTIADLELQRSRPEFLSQEALLAALYGKHPAALAAPPAASIMATTAADLRRFYATHYSPDAALLVVVGDVTLDSVLPTVRRVFGDWKASRTSLPSLPPTPAPSPRSVHLVDRPGSVQTVIQLGAIGITRTDRDYFALQVMNEILGGKSSSRLFQNLREKNGYTYGAYSGFTATAIPGVWQITTPVRTEVTAGALQELFTEMQRMRREPVSATELASAKRSLVGKYIFSLERPDALLDNVVTRVLYGLPSDYWDRYTDKVQAVSAEDVKRVAERIIDLEHLQIAAVGDAGRVRDIFAKYGAQWRPGQSTSTPGGSPAPSGRPTFSQDERALLRTTIVRIADQLVSTAIEKPGGGIGWNGADENGKPLETFNVYDGNSGISYFLLKASKALGDGKYRQAAERSMAYILSQSQSDEHGRFIDPGTNGVFVGNAGPAYLYLYAYQTTGRAEYLNAAESFARRIVAVPDVKRTSSPDIISGAAGTGLLLLKMHEATNDPVYLDGAKRLGDFLVEQAEARGDGVTWRLNAEGKEYYFVGFSHGPAGIGYYLDRLYRATSADRFRIAADQAMRHIEAVALRENDWVKWYHEQLRRPDRYPSQWCHGAPGMNPFFLELYSRDTDKRMLQWAIANTRYLLHQGVDIRQNAGVCHGISGNVASLYQLYRLTSDPDYLSAVKDGLATLYDTLGVSSGHLPWDRPGHEVDSSYMTGLAGVGDFLVLLYSEGRLNMFGPLGYGDDLPALEAHNPAQARFAPR